MQGKAGLWFRRALGVCLLLGAWQLASLFFPPLVVPPIAQVLSTLVRLMTQSDFGATIGTTILRLIAGLAIGVGVGAVLGLLFGLCPKIEDVGTPLIHVLQAIPPVCWVVLALVWFGLKMLRHVTLPSIRPYFRSALEIVIGGGWKLAVMGEVLTTNSGIGGAITTARLNIEPDAIIAWSLLLVLGCYLTQRLLRMAFCGKEGVTC